MRGSDISYNSSGSCFPGQVWAYYNIVYGNMIM